MDKTDQRQYYSVLIIDKHYKISLIIKNIKEFTFYQDVGNIYEASKLYVEHFKKYKHLFDAILINIDDIHENNEYTHFINDIQTTNPFQNIMVYSNNYSDENIQQLIKFGIVYHKNNPTNIKNFDYNYENINDTNLFTFYRLINASFSVLKNNYLSAILSLDDMICHYDYKSCIVFTSDEKNILCKISIEEKLLHYITTQVFGMNEMDQKELLFSSICDEFNNTISGLAIQFISSFYHNLKLGLPKGCDTIDENTFTNLCYSKSIQTIHGALCLELKI